MEWVFKQSIQIQMISVSLHVFQLLRMMNLFITSSFRNAVTEHSITDIMEFGLLVSKGS